MSERYKESFDDNSGLIFDDYVTNKSAQRSYDSRVGMPVTQPLKKIGTAVPLTLNSKQTSGGRRIGVTPVALHWACNPVQTVPFRTFISDMLDNTVGLSKPEPKCLSCEGAFNKTVFFKQGPTHYLGYNYKTKTIRMLSKANLTADQFMKCCQWKLVLGLSGDANTCSILHMEQDAYLSRLPDTAQVKGSMIIIPAEVVQGNELGRQMATFHLIDGLNTRAAVSLMPLSIGKETRVRVAEIAASGMPHIVEYANEHVVDYKASTFECVDSINEYPVISNRFTVNGNHLCSNTAANQDTVCTGIESPAQCNATGVTHNSRSRLSPRGEMGLEFSVSGTAHSDVFEPFQDSSNGPNKRCSKSSGKRLLAACVDEGELTDAELSKAELFQNVSQPQITNGKPTLFTAEFNPQTANIFDSHTGSEFNAILNAGVSQKRNELTDNIFYKLEDAKMDPDVNNLLEYNESRYNIYKKENGDFETKIYDRIKKHTDTVDGLIIDMNNYRVKNMAQDFFFLGDKLIKSRGSNNN